jgi:hypothetical protein
LLFGKTIKTSNRLKKLVAIIFATLLIISLFSKCAKIVSPSGGPKDTLAPVMVRSNPAINSVNFKGEKLSITFNEYIQLKDIQKKFAISPPMLKKPEINQRGKNLDIKFNEPLKANTTYTLYFADAVTDNNEGNAIKNFDFAFSTGSTIDSLTVSGKILNAFTLQPEEDAFIMLYENQEDSAPIKEIPRYLTRANKKGIFYFKNLESKDFKVFALKDFNSNYKFDQISEEIAFQSVPLKKESLKGPSLIDTSRFAKREINLYMFKENSRFQARTGFARTQRRKLALSFTKKPEGLVKLIPMNFKDSTNWYLKEMNQTQDSLIYWISNNSISSIDTLKLLASYLKTDSLQQLKPQIDTLKFIYTDPEKEVSRKRKSDRDKETKKTYLKVNSSIRNTQVVKPSKALALAFPMPINGFDEGLVTITNLKDSLKLEGIKWLRDTLNPRLYTYSNAWNPDEQYKFEALPGAFTSLDGVQNDTITFKFIGANPDNFGVLNITLLNIKKTAIVELLNEKKSQVLERFVVNPDQKLSIKFIDPGKYTLRFIDDLNMNRMWDTGWYINGFQPERVFYYDEGKTKGLINIRANWENEITFDFGNK